MGRTTHEGHWYNLEMKAGAAPDWGAHIEPTDEEVEEGDYVKLTTAYGQVSVRQIEEILDVDSEGDMIVTLVPE